MVKHWTRCPGGRRFSILGGAQSPAGRGPDPLLPPVFPVQPPSP